MFNSKNGAGMYKARLSPGVVQRSLCLQYCYCLTYAWWKRLRVHCTSLCRWLTWELTIWLNVDALQETLTLC